MARHLARRALQAIAIAATAGALAAAPATAAPPANDNFGDAQVLTGALPFDVLGTNAEATKELGEPNHAGNGGGASIWYGWTAPASGQVVVDTCNAGFDTLLAVYTGDSVAALTRVVSNDDSSGCARTNRSRVTVAASAGTTYRIAIDGFAAETGPIRLTIRALDPPANDDFAEAQSVAGELPIEVAGTNVDAGKESGEPDHAGQRGGSSIWYRWTPSAARAGGDRDRAAAMSSNTLLGVYTGSAVSALTKVASNNNAERPGCFTQSAVQFTPTSGETYSIAVDGGAGTQGAIVLTIRATDAAANDDFANAEPLPGSHTIDVSGTTAEASKEPGEPAHAGNRGGASVWYRWTPDASGTVGLHACASGFDTLLAVYTGSSVDGLTEVASNDDSCFTRSRVEFTATAGETYWIAVDGYNGQTGAFTLANPPVNDAFADAETLTGALPIAASATNVGAGRQAGEPGHVGDLGGASVWFSWTPDTSRTVVIDTCDSDFDTLLAVYTGDAVDALTPIAANDDGCGERSAVDLKVTAGQTYRIAVDGFHEFVAAQGAIELTIRAPSVPVNDAFADAAALGGMLPINTHGSSADATKQPGEPDHGLQPGGASLWYRWTPSKSDVTVIDTCRSRFDTLLGVYTGETVDGLNVVASDDDGCGPAAGSKVRFEALAGTTYWIAIDDIAGVGGPFGLAVSLPPANDEFANAEALGGALPIDVSGSIVDATIEPDEPTHGDAGEGSSIWYSWTPTSTRKVAIETCASPVATVLAIYTGESVGGLAPVYTNFLKPSCHSASATNAGVVLLAHAGTTYRIAVDRLGNEPGPIALAIRHADSPANDDFARANELRSALPVAVSGTSVDATIEPGEPPSGDSTVWYRWKAAASGAVVIDACGSGLATGGLLSVYTGGALDGLTEVTGEPGDCDLSRVIAATAGETYEIAFGGFFGATGSIELTLRKLNRPVNDAFANAQVLSGALPLTATGTNVDSSTEPGEPFHGDHSVWHRWTPTVSGPVAIETCGSGSEAQLGLYTGGSVDALTEVARSSRCGELSGSRVVFTATAGTTYRLPVGGETGPIRLTIRAADRPANDDFADAQPLAGARPIRATGTLLDASEQPGEQLLTDGPSVWYRWTADATGPVVVETCGSDADTQLDVYRGSSFASLTGVADDANGCGRQSHVQFAATAGATYRIAVSGARSGTISVTIRDPDSPANDDFAGAHVLTGSPPITVTGTNVDATHEVAERFHTPEGVLSTASVWYRWTADASGPVTIETCGSHFQTVLAVYTGRTLGNLTEVASNAYTPGCGSEQRSRVSFAAAAGTTYRIAVDGVDDAAGAIALAIRRPPVNDDINDARPLTGDVPATNTDATKQPGEPDHAGDRGGASIWYEWTAVATGDVGIKAKADGFTPLLAAYTGSAVNRLTLVRAGDRKLKFQAKAGQTYLIAVDGRDGRTGQIEIDAG